MLILRRTVALYLFILTTAITSSANTDTTLYVDQNASGNNNGSSWLNAYIDVQSALDAAAAMPGHEEIRIAAGLYRPPAVPGQENDRLIGYALPGGVTLRGGYPGVSPAPDENGEFRTVFSTDEFLPADVMIEFVNADAPSEVVDIDFGGVTVNSVFSRDSSVATGFAVDNAELSVRHARFLGHYGFGSPLEPIVIPFELTDATLLVQNCHFERVIEPPFVLASGSDITVRDLNLSAGALSNPNTETRWNTTLVDGIESNITLADSSIINVFDESGGAFIFRLAGGNVTISGCHLVGDSDFVTYQSDQILILDSSIANFRHLGGSAERLYVRNSVLENFDMGLTGSYSRLIELENSVFDRINRITFSFQTPIFASNCTFQNPGPATTALLRLGRGSIVEDCVFRDIPAVAVGSTDHSGTGPTVQVRRCRFERNHKDITATALIEITDSDFIDSGGVSINHPNDPGLSRIENCKFEDIVTTFSAVAVYSPTILRGCLFKNNQITFVTNSQQVAGALLIRGAFLANSIYDTVQVEDCEFVGNSGPDAGAVLIERTRNAIITRCRFRNNWAYDDYPDAGDEMGRGGAVSVEPESISGDLVIIDSCEFFDNVALQSQGGALRAKCRQPSITNCRFERNYADLGGAYHYDNPQTPCLIFNSSFAENLATSEGGAIRLPPDHDAEIVNCKFIKNEAGYAGGGFAMAGRSFTTIDDSVFFGNRGGISGAIWCGSSQGIVGDNQSNCRINNSVIAGNVSNNGIAGIGAEFTNLEVNNCTIASNYSENQTLRATGIDTRYSVTTIRNSILYNNSVPNVSALSSEFSASSPFSDNYPVSLRHNNIRGLPPELQTDGNISVDPLFADPAGPDGLIGTADDDYSLQLGSPCHDAGDNEPLLAILATQGLDPADARDLRGGFRFDNDATVPPDMTDDAAMFPVDMGAYEFNDCDGNGTDDNIDITLGTLDDCDNDGVPDACDDPSDTDADGIVDDCDNCPTVAQQTQADADADGIGDACDLCPGADDRNDVDQDGLPDGCDPCLYYRAGDASRDGFIDLDDLAEFVEALRFGENHSNSCGADANNDGKIDGRDIAPFTELLLLND